MENRKKASSRIRRKNNGIRKILLFLILIFIIIMIIAKVIFPGIRTFSRYVYSAIRSFYLNSQEFYFNSDKLAKETAFFESSNWSGTGEYEVPIKMNSRKNLEEHSKTNIEYQIHYEYKAFKANGEEYPLSTVDFYLRDSGKANIPLNAAQTITGMNILTTANYEDLFYFALKTTTALNSKDYVWVKITATSTKPYVETLTGEFKLIIGSKNVIYKIEDAPYNPYAQLIITNELDSYVNKSDSNDVLSIDEYLALTDAQKENYYSKKIELSFDPTKVVLDTTSDVYIEAISNSDTTDLGYGTVVKTYDDIDNQTGNEIQTTESHQFVNYISFYIEAEESKVIKFYKINASQDYTYDSDDDYLVVNVSYT